MYQSSVHEDERNISLMIKWEPDTLKSFAIALAIVSVFMWFLTFFTVPEARTVKTLNNTVPTYVLINWGDGDGTGLSSGNLQEEGRAHKGNDPASPIHDAEVAAKTKPSDNSSVTMDESNNIVAVDELSSSEKNSSESDRGNSNKNVGTRDGDESGQGLGFVGSGRGKGQGFGDIDWGGGGNRVVLKKVFPKFPDGVRTSAHIKIKFTVLADGTVGKMVPLQKADPRLERAAMDALRRWRFNPIDSDVEMQGTIPLTFVLR